MLSRYAIHYYDWANTVESRIEDLHLNNMTPRQLFVFQPSEDTKVTIVREGKFPLGMVSKWEASTSKNGEGLKGNAREDHQFIVIKVFLRTGRLFSPLSG